MIERKTYVEISSETMFKDLLKLFKHKKYLTSDKSRLVMFYSELSLKEKDIIDSITGYRVTVAQPQVFPYDIIVVEKK